MICYEKSLKFTTLSVKNLGVNQRASIQSHDSCILCLPGGTDCFPHNIDSRVYEFSTRNYYKLICQSSFYVNDFLECYLTPCGLVTPYGDN